jgi:molybdopterin/thiamine biosynthesis adenylyltransferase
VNRPHPDERFARFGLVDWWDQRRLAEARVVVIGAGALGNELVKNCALLGVGSMVIVDFDRIELSNLSRAVLFRARDAASAKAAVAARAARDLYPDVRAVALDADVVHGVGLGLFRWADVVLGALDNREARLAVNRACYRVGRPFIDGGIDVLSGAARVFLPPEGACYECTLGDADWEALAQRHSCSLLNRELVEFGKVPTTPTTASIVAGVQAQEALKLLHGQPTLSGAAFVFEGRSHTSYVTTFQRSPDCLSHEPLPRVVETGCCASALTAAQALALVRAELGPEAHLEFARELLEGFDCPGCGATEASVRPLTSVTETEASCPSCGARRAPRLFHALRGGEAVLDWPLAQLGVPPWDVVLGRHGERLVGLELDGDRAAVLGPVAAQGAGGAGEGNPG